MELVFNEAIYEKVVQGEVPSAGKFVWLVTADIKDMHVERAGGRFVPFLEILAGLVRDGVEVRLIHAKDPGPRFREDFDRFPELLNSDCFERVLCPRMHMKCVVVDGVVAYVGSANLTGAGMGAKSPDRRNIEAGFLVRDEGFVREIMEFLDRFWVGESCESCRRRDVCPDPIV